MTDIRCLSLTRPWPWAILHAGKRIENRQRADGRMPSLCRYRGPLLLHAAKSWDMTAGEWMLKRGLLGPGCARHVGDAVDWMMIPHRWAQEGLSCTGWENRDRHHPAGVIFARCNVVGHIEPDRHGYWQCEEPPPRPLIVMGAGPEGYYSDYQPVDRSIRIRSYGYDDEATEAAAKDLDLRWWMGGYALVLADVEPTPLVLCRGALGLWRPPAGVLAQLDAA